MATDNLLLKVTSEIQQCFGSNDIAISPVVFNHRDELIKLRRHFHQYPELSFEEYKTSKYIANYLSSLNCSSLSIQRNVAKTGIIAVLKGNKAGKCIGLRADIDALPIDEQNDFEYKSKNKNIAHACGHDAHIAILLVTCKILCLFQSRISGSIKFIFQPAEEGKGGAKAMVDAGCLNNPSVDQIYGLHVSSTRKVGGVHVNCEPKPLMSGACMFRILIKGIGGHGAYPHMTKDVVLTCGSLINQIHSIVSRNINPSNMGIITIGKIISGVKGNVIADTAELDGTIRWYQSNIGNILKNRLQTVCNGVATSFDVDIKLVIEQPEFPPVINHQIGYKTVCNAASRIFQSNNNDNGHGLFNDCEASSASEDFAYYLLEKPGSFFFVGAQREEFINDPMGSSHHTSTFKIDERCMIIGCQMFIQIVNDLLMNSPKLFSKL